MGDCFSARIEAVVAFGLYSVAIEKLQCHFFNVKRNNRRGGKAGGLDSRAVNEVMRFSSAFDDEILLKRRGTDTGKIGDDVAASESVGCALLFVENVGNTLGICCVVFLFKGFNRVRADKQIMVNCMNYSAALGVTCAGRLFE